MLNAAFSGVYPATVDDKGRIHVPSAISREVADDETMMLAIQSNGLHESLIAFARPAYLAMLSDLMERGKADRDQRRRLKGLAERFYPSTIKSGKLLIPQEIRRSFKLNKNVQVVGAVDHIEIWDEAAWTAKNGKNGIRLMRDDLDELGIL